MRAREPESDTDPQLSTSRPAPRGRIVRRALVVAGAVAVGLTAWLFLFTSGHPSDALMVSRFERHPPALIDMCPPTFSSEQAERRWFRALRIYRSEALSDCQGVFFWVSRSEGRAMFGYHWDDHKGYAWMPGRPEEDTNPIWRVRPPRSYAPYALSPIAGDWYVFKVRMHRP